MCTLESLVHVYSVYRGLLGPVCSHVAITKPHTDVRDVKDVTPLHAACQVGGKELVQYLVEECKCDVGESVSVILFVHVHMSHSWL